MADIRVRFAPSPTGHLHIGGVRTALFNWLFARHHRGVFILRIEDTDRSRSTEEAVQAIIVGLTWLGLDWDEGPYRQTERMDLYRRHVERLLAEGKAYHCYCLPEELEARRAQALARKETPKYDGRCRTLSTPLPGRTPAVRFRTPTEGQVEVDDLVKGKVTFDNAQLDDLIILRADGIPTYNLCVVVDDAEMRISHVIRGDDHLNNTPRQIHLYRAFGYEPPSFGHLPMILGPDRTRLSKRHGATSVMAYKEMGFLPEAIVNYLVRLGWSHGDQEVFSLKELVEMFSLDHVTPSAAVFNPEKLLWLNSHYIREAGPARIAGLLTPFLITHGLLKERKEVAQDMLEKMISALMPRSRTLEEMARMAACYLTDEVEIDPKARTKFLRQEVAPLLQKVIQRFEALPAFTQGETEKVFQEIIAETGGKMSDLAQPVRVAVTGRTVSPGIYETLELIGQQRAIQRLRKAVHLIGSHRDIPH